MPSIFSDHNGTKLEINNRRVIEETQTHKNLNKTLLNNQWVREKMLQETIAWVRQKLKHSIPKLRGCSKIISDREVSHIKKIERS